MEITQLGFVACACVAVMQTNVVSDVTVIRWGLLLHMLAYRGLPCVAGVCGNPWQKYTEAKTVQLRAPLLPNPQAPR